MLIRIDPIAEVHKNLEVVAFFFAYTGDSSPIVGFLQKGLVFSEHVLSVQYHFGVLRSKISQALHPSYH